MMALLDYHFEHIALDEDDCLAVPALMREVKGVSFYDCSNRALALRSRGPYVTADAEYVKKMK
jgi:hypothetical protein